MKKIIRCALFFCAMMAMHLEGAAMIIGHRGACGHAPENTLTSFAKALEMGVDAVELDVYALPSGELIVFHDEMLDRVSDGKGSFANKTLSEIKEYTIEGFERIPTLDEVCDLIDKRCIVNIELKGAKTAESVAAFIKKLVLEEKWRFDHFLVSSFDHHELFSFHQMLPEVQTGAIMEGIPLSYAAFAVDVRATHIVLCRDAINQAFVQDAHQRGLQVFVYTVNSQEDMKCLIDMGVDGLITNYPDRAQEFRKSAK